MKKGFTLAEVLITLGIIGVIVAIMLPLINKARPVSEKAMYLKTYDSIVSTVHSLANNKNAFPVTDEKHLDYSEYPLLNFGDGSLAGNPISGETKLQDAILIAFNAETGTTPNGITLNIKTKKEEKSNNDGYSGTYKTTITFSLPNNKQDFTVYVYADGKVVPADDIGAGYINTRTNWFKRGKNGSSKQDDHENEYKLSCLSGYTFDAAQKTCKLSGEDDGDDDGNGGGEGEACTAVQIQAQAAICASQNKLSNGTCNSCGGCKPDYTIASGGKCEQKQNIKYTWIGSVNLSWEYEEDSQECGRTGWNHCYDNRNGHSTQTIKAGEIVTTTNILTSSIKDQACQIAEDSSHDSNNYIYYGLTCECNLTAQKYK